MPNINFKFTCLFILSTSATINDLSAATFSLGDVFNGLTNIVSQNSDKTSEPQTLVKDSKDGPILSSKPYLRGLASIDYSRISTRQDSNKYGGLYESAARSHAAPMINHYITHAQESKGLRVLLNDATKKIHLERDKEETKKVYSNPYSNNVSVFDLSKLNDFGRSEYQSFYNYEIKTHIKLPEQYIKNGKVVFEDLRGPAIVYSRGADSYNSFSQVCFQKIDGKFMPDKKMTITVSKENTVDYSISCYFGGYPTVPELGIGQGRKDSLKDISEAQSVLPLYWNVYAIPSPLDKGEPEKYKITSKDIFLYEKEVQ